MLLPPLRTSAQLRLYASCRKLPFVTGRSESKAPFQHHENPTGFACFLITESSPDNAPR